MNILFLNRAKSPNRFSFETLFSNIKKNLTNTQVFEFYDKTYPSFWKNLKAVKKIECDVIHITGGIGYYAIFLPKNKTILTIHDTNHYEYDLKGLKKWLFGLIFYRLPIKNVKYVTVVSEKTKERLIELFKVSEFKIKVIPNCYSEELSFQEKLFSKKNIQLLQIGTKPNKNIPNLIEAIIGLDVQLTIIGKLPNSLIKILDSSGIKWINKYNLSEKEMKREYLNCDIVTFVSLSEGFGLPIIEANAVGRPVITSNISSMPEVANNAAMLVNPNNPSEIKKGILKIIEDEDFRNSLVENGLKNIERFRPETISNLYMNLYKKLN